MADKVDVPTQIYTFRSPQIYVHTVDAFGTNMQQRVKDLYGDESKLRKFLAFFKLDYLLNKDGESQETVYTSVFRNSRSRLFRIKCKNVFIWIVLLLGAFLLYYTSESNRGCKPTGNTLCRIDRQLSKSMILGSNEWNYNYNYSLKYKDYCQKMAPYAHSLLSVREDMKGKRQYFRISDIHQFDNDTQQETIFNPDKNEWLKRLNYYIGYINNPSSNTTNEVDVVCTFESGHSDYIEWIKEKKDSISKERDYFQVSSEEKNIDFVHSFIYGVDGLWDVSKSMILNKMLSTILSGESNCSCAQDHGFFKNIIMVKDDDGSIRTMYNAKIDHKSGSMMSIKKPETSYLNYVINNKILIHSEITVEYLDVDRYSHTIQLYKDDAVCIMFCTMDDVFFS
jgi:hypothetical protein